ncbi:hypothetical protein [Panacagrimonas sp.]|uniref:hypothetical protein n=1 Tax=Panacagrimonas sp. TaxID=2480088 RepID=UPI003B518797
MHTSKTISLLALLGLLSACGGLRSFRDLDANQDGRIDRVEVSQSPKVADLFDSGDDDDSGDLEPAEYDSIVLVLEREHRNVPRRSSGGGNVDVGH